MTTKPNETLRYFGLITLFVLPARSRDSFRPYLVQSFSYKRTLRGSVAILSQSYNAALIPERRSLSAAVYYICLLCVNCQPCVIRTVTHKSQWSFLLNFPTVPCYRHDEVCLQPIPVLGIQDMDNPPSTSRNSLTKAEKELLEAVKSH